MRSRQTRFGPKTPLPRLWLMSDERIGGEEALLRALERLPRGSGIVFRHYSLPLADRKSLFKRVRGAARRKRLILFLAGSERLARAWKADGFHRRAMHRAHCEQSAPVHDLREIRQAERAGATLLFLSPIFSTRSHPGARALGRTRFTCLARRTRLPVIALGGMTHDRARSLGQLGAHGWAAIDGLGQTHLRSCRAKSRHVRAKPPSLDCARDERIKCKVIPL